MARTGEWAVREPSGKQRRLAVDRGILGTRTTLDGRTLERFDQTPEADRHVASIAGHVLTVVVPRDSNVPPTLNVDGTPALGAEVTLAPTQDTARAGGLAVTGKDLERHQLVQRATGGSSWFYWVGGASILNSVLNAAGVQWGLAVGLGITYLIDGVAQELSNTVRTPIYAFVIDVAVAGMFLLIGRAAQRGRLGWYAAGTVLYLLDGLLFVLAQDLLGIAVHAIAIWGLVSGWRAARALKRFDAPAAALVG